MMEFRFHRALPDTATHRQGMHRAQRKTDFSLSPRQTLLAASGSPFGSSTGAANWHQGHMKHSPPVRTGTAQLCTDRRVQGGQRPRTLQPPQPLTEDSAHHPLDVPTGMSKMVSGPASPASGEYACESHSWVATRMRRQQFACFGQDAQATKTGFNQYASSCSCSPICSVPSSVQRG